MTQRPSDEIARIIRDGTAIDRAMIAARRRVILRHRQMGVPLVIWRDGKVAEVAPDSVELPSDGDEADSQQRPANPR